MAGLAPSGTASAAGTVRRQAAPPSHPLVLGHPGLPLPGVRGHGSVELGAEPEEAGSQCRRRLRQGGRQRPAQAWHGAGKCLHGHWWR